MNKQMPSSIKWIRGLSYFYIVTNILLVVYLILLAAMQPAGGYLPTGGLGSFNYGLVSSVTGQRGNGPILFDAQEAGRASAGSIFIILIFGGVLYSLKKGKLTLLRILLTLVLLLTLSKGNIIGLIMAVILLILSFRKSAKDYLS